MTERGRIWLTLGILVVIGIAILLIVQPWQRPTPQPSPVTQQPPPEQPTPPPTTQPPVEQPPPPPLPTSPQLSLSASSISFGSVRVDSPASGSFTISNSGGGILEGSISCSGDCSIFEFSPSSFRLTAGETLQVQVTFQPRSATSYSATLNISGNGGSGSISLGGLGYQPPLPPPSKIASVQHPIFLGDPEKPVLVVIEESHAGLAVQSNCTMAIEALLATGMPHVLLVEGTAPERVDLSSMFEAGEELYRMAAAEAWFELGWLTGVEIAALRHPSVPLYGVENPQGPERLAHLEALRTYEKAFDNVLGHVNELYTSLVKGGRVPARVEQALKKRDQAYNALAQLPAGTLPLELLTETLSRGQAQGLPVHQTLKELQQRFSEAETTTSELRVRYEEAREDLFIAIIESAESQGSDVSSARQSLEKLRQARSNKESARGDRDKLMITNATEILASIGASIGILVVGAGHTLQLTADLKRAGISYVVVTPNALEQKIAEREMEWFEQRLSKKPSPIEKWLDKGYKPELYLATPEGRKTFVTGVALLELLNRALHGEPVSVPAHTLISTVTVTPLAGKVSLHIQGLSGNSLHLTFPTALELTKTTAKELVLHLLEALEAADLLRPREDGFFTPAVHLYLEPDGRRGGAFVSYVSGSTLSTEIVPFDLPSPAVDMLKAYEDVVAMPPSKITREGIVQGQPQSLLRPVFILQPVVATLNRVLDELRTPKNQIVPVALRMARVSGEAYLRDINFTELLGFVRKAGLSGFERRLILVKSALEHDSELIKIGSPEKPLFSTLKNVHAWGSTAKHVAVFTIPTTESLEEWTANDFAQYLGGDRREWYKSTILPLVGEAINALGKENVLEPQNLNELLEGLKKVLADVTDATVTLTFVGHKVAGREGLVLHFKGSGSEAPLNQVVQEIRLMQERGSIPKSAQLEFNVIVCSAEAEAAENFVKQLGARLVLASPHALGVIMNLKLLTLQARKLSEGMPGYQAYLEAMEELIQKILDGRLEPPSLEMPAPSAREENDEASASRA